ncbi:DUF6745 domain-containing protein [Scytonema sp. NUACC26]|uniref:DUF6745 domain-containing protein n=1 Tax=Scytonema sp. NUACC26 TaxID=3140176 RepID=UPI0034DBEEF1
MSQGKKQLSHEQQALMSIIQNEWIRIALDTSPTDKQQAETAIVLAYESAELEPPQHIIWFDNPLVAVSWIVLNKNFVGRFFYYPVLKFKKALNAASEKLVDPAVLEDLQFGYFYTIGEQLTSISSILDATQEIVAEALLKRFGDNYSPVWTDIIEAKHCGFWWCFKDLAVVTPKPSAIHLDTEDRLHAEGVPAVVYRGFEIYAEHGVRLSEKYD